MSVGHVRERPAGSGRWELRAYVGRDPLTGRKLYETRTVTASGRRAAEHELTAFVTELDEHGATSSGTTFGDLLEKWYAVRRAELTPGGARETRRRIDTYLAPLKPRKLEELAGRGGTAILDTFYAALRERGGRCRRRNPVCPPETWPCKHGGGGPLDASTVNRIHHDVRSAFNQGLVWDMVRRNPATLASPGAVLENEIDPPETGDLLQLFAAAEAQDQDNPEFAVFLILAAVTGARRGEMCALWWEDVNFDAGTVDFGHVISMGDTGPARIRKGRGKANRKGKARKGTPLDAGTLAVLRAHRTRCAERAMLAGVALPEQGYVFAADGIGDTPWNPDSTSRRFRRLRDQVGLDGTRLHDLRHFVVTTLLGAGFATPTVAGRVGHSRRSTTALTVYGHRQDDADRAAAELLGRLLERPVDDTPPADDDADIIPLHG